MQTDNIYLEVAINNTAYNVDKLFTYKAPEELKEMIEAGKRVVVPFGASNKKLEGIIINIKNETDFKHIKPISKILDDNVVIDEEGFGIASFIKDRYLCTYYEALRQVMPPGLKTIIKESVRLLLDYDENTFKNDSNKIKIINILKENNNILYKYELEELSGVKNFNKHISDLVMNDVCVLEYVNKENVSSKSISTVNFIGEYNETNEYIEKYKASKRAQVRVLKTLIDNPKFVLTDLKSICDCTEKTINSLEKEGFIEIEEVEVLRNPYAQGTEEKTEKKLATFEQEIAIKAITKSVVNGESKTHLLYGVTGSGKTEVYLQVIDECINLGKQAIVLVPEISLTPQMVRRFFGRFTDKVAVLHSGLTLNERYDEWKKIKSGEVSVVVGARSAIFAPFKNLGIIIIDEEHELSYKSESQPKYDAVEVAKFRSSYNSVPLVLASATPTIVSYYKAMQNEYNLITMQNRYNNNALPEVEIVDMRDELKQGNFSPISIRLREEIKSNIENKEQTILFLNRRGHSTFVSCRSCGFVAKCPNCDITLTFHSYANKLSCHYCGYEIKNYDICPICQSKYIRYFGSGTQKIEEEILTLFPASSVIRMDVDTTRKKFSHEKLLNKFSNENIDILLGTQMISKGLDFPNVTLSGVLAADSSLYIDDYRSCERAFSQITQVCGRAGRGEKKGRAIVQTYNPNHYAVECALNHDYKKFYETEIIFRKVMQYPPFCDIINITISSPSALNGNAAIKSISEYLEIELNLNNKKDKIVKVFGPSPAPISKIKNKYRYRIMIKCLDSYSLKKVMEGIKERYYSDYKDKNMYFSIDVNPVNML